MNMLTNPAFIAYAVTALILVANLMFLWGYSGLARSKVKSTLNAEDAAYFKATLVENDPPQVARILRAHANAQATIFPFLFLGFIFVMAGGNTTFAIVLFSVFTIARLLHTFAYLKRLQPWRTILFALSGACIFILLFDIAWLVLRTA